MPKVKKLRDGTDFATQEELDGITPASIGAATDAEVLHLAETETASGLKKFTLGIWSGVVRALTGGHVDIQNASGDSILRVGDGGGTGVAEGYDTTASGDRSHAEGYITTASGLASHAEGESTTASGNASHAEGGSTTASGDYCHAEGYNTTANGYFCHAEGYDTTASGYFSHAGGRKAKAIYDGTRVISDSQDTDVSSTTTDQLTARFQNGYEFKGGAANFDGAISTPAVQSAAGRRVTVAGTSLTINSANAATYNGRVIDFTSASAVALTLDNSIPADWSCRISQEAAGVVTATQSGGTTINGATSLATSGIYSAIEFYKTASGFRANRYTTQASQDSRYSSGKIATANLDRTSTTTFAADTTLTVDLPIGVYRIDSSVSISIHDGSPAGVGAKIRWNATGGTASLIRILIRGWDLQVLNGPSNVGLRKPAKFITLLPPFPSDELAFTGSANHFFKSELIIEVTAPTTFALEWAQVTSSAKIARRDIGSDLIVTRISP